MNLKQQRHRRGRESTADVKRCFCFCFSNHCLCYPYHFYWFYYHGYRFYHRFFYHHQFIIIIGFLIIISNIVIVIIFIFEDSNSNEGIQKKVSLTHLFFYYRENIFYIHTWAKQTCKSIKGILFLNTLSYQTIWFMINYPTKCLYISKQSHF